MNPPKHALQRTAPCVTAPASTAAQSQWGLTPPSSGPSPAYGLRAPLMSNVRPGIVMGQLKRLKYYQGATRFWLQASELQRSRCLAPSSDSAAARADMNFYVVAVQRLRELARLCADRANLPNARALLTQFDNQWPRFRELRDKEEHSTGPGADEAPYGIWYFSDVVAELGRGGSVSFLVRVDDTQESARHLARGIDELLTTELAKWPAP